MFAAPAGPPSGDESSSVWWRACPSRVVEPFLCASEFELVGTRSFIVLFGVVVCGQCAGTQMSSPALSFSVVFVFAGLRFFRGSAATCMFLRRLFSNG